VPWMRTPLHERGSHGDTVAMVVGGAIGAQWGDLTQVRVEGSVTGQYRVGESPRQNEGRLRTPILRKGQRACDGHSRAVRRLLRPSAVGGNRGISRARIYENGLVPAT